MKRNQDKTMQKVNFKKSCPVISHQGCVHLCNYIMMGEYSLWSGVFIWKKTSKTHESGMTQIMRKKQIDTSYNPIRT